MKSLNWIDRLLVPVAPRWALARARARRALAYYEAANPDRLRKGRRETGSGNAAVQRAGQSLRQQARHLEQNYDLALGVINALVMNTVGPNGIGVEPQPRRPDGSIHDGMARQLLDLWKDWCKRPEVTWQHDWPSAQRLMARSWFRDGEVFAQLVEGTGVWLDHGTRVPLSLEMLEADYVPLEYSQPGGANVPTIVQGIEINAWGRPIAYYVYKQHPLESGILMNGANLKRLPADRVLHLANRHRIRQLRGVSVLASVINRFDDLKDYEESERIAAKVAASMAAYIKKGVPEDYEAPSDASEIRELKFRPGMIFDDLLPGEDIGTIDTKRPNPNLEAYRSAQLRAIAAGTGPTYSTVARTYDGTYSAQRQELVEGWSVYATLSAEFADRIVRPVYERFVALALAAGLIRLDRDVVEKTLDDALYLAPQMPWVDPLKEASAWAVLEDRCYISGPEIVRKRGGNPADVLEQQLRWTRAKRERGLDAPSDSLVSVSVPEEEDETPPRRQTGRRRVNGAARTAVN